MTRSVYAHLERHPRQRVLLFALAGVGLFALGAAYIRLQRRPDPLAHQVTGGDLLAPGWPLALRVRARSAHGGVMASPEVSEVTLGGRSVPFTQRRGDPTLLEVAVPPDLAVGGLAVPVALTVREPTSQSPLTFRLAASPRDPGGEAPRRGIPPLAPTKRAVRVDLQPERGELVSHLDNHVFVRVMDPAGQPLAGASLRVSHAEAPKGLDLAPTDGDGLTWFDLDPRRPNFDVRAAVSHPALQTATTPGAARPVETVQPLYAAGRQMGVEGLPPVLPPGKTHSVTIKTTRDAGDLHCDLRRGRLHFAAWQVPVSASGDASLTLPALSAPGRYTLQCYFHVLLPGTTSLSRAFWVGDPAEPRALLEAGLNAGLLRPDAPRAAPEALRWPWLVARLSEPTVVSGVLLNTLPEAIRAADAAWERQKALALASLAGAIFLLLLVGLDLALSHALTTRARLRAWEAEAAASGALATVTDGIDPVAHLPTDRLARTRGWLLLVVAVGTVAANVAGFLLLSGMFLN